MTRGGLADARWVSESFESLLPLFVVVVLYPLPLGSESFCRLDRRIDGGRYCSSPIFVDEYAWCNGNRRPTCHGSQCLSTRGEDSWASCWFLEVAHRFRLLSELIQLAFGTDFGISFLFTLPLTRLSIKVEPLVHVMLICGFVVELGHGGEADDRSFDFHPFRNLDTLELNLFGLVESSILFDLVECGFELRCIVFHLSLAVRDKLFVCSVPVLRVLWFV